MKKLFKFALFAFLGVITAGLFLIGYSIYILYKETRFDEEKIKSMSDKITGKVFFNFVAGVIILAIGIFGSGEKAEKTAPADEQQVEQTAKTEEPVVEEESDESSSIQSTIESTTLASASLGKVDVQENAGTKKEGDYVANVDIEQNVVWSGRKTCDAGALNISNIVNDAFEQHKNLTLMQFGIHVDGSEVASVRIKRQDWENHSDGYLSKEDIKNHPSYRESIACSQ